MTRLPSFGRALAVGMVEDQAHHQPCQRPARLDRQPDQPGDVPVTSSTGLLDQVRALLG